MSHFVITGAVGGNTQGALAPNRLEINDFVKNELLFSLYVQALAAMSKVPQKDRASFFQIGGIHGLPYIAWDGAGADDPAEHAGYCTHGSVLFPTWHRPYVTVYEQILQAHAKEIAETYKVNKDRWVKAAADLRQPFWDWAKNIVPPAEVISLRQVTITTPDGKRTQVDNPIFQYKFNPIEPTFPAPFSNWQTTLRHPTSDNADAQDDIEGLKTTLRGNQKDVKTKTFNLLSRVHTWPAFSNHTPNDGGDSSNSLEAIHDGIHNLVGGTGHMGDIAVAGFDPIFYMHHCNVDRLLSLWAALNPTVWVTENIEEDGTWTIPIGAKVDKNTPLTPFWSSQSDFWTSTEAAGAVPKQLGYSYPEFNGLDMGNQQAVKTRIAQIVNQLYGGTTFGRRPVGPLAHATAATHQQGAHVHVGSGSTAPSKPIPSAPAPAAASGAPAGHEDKTEAQVTVADVPAGSDGNGFWDWTVRIHIKKYEVGGSFSVPLFLGTVPSNPREWRTTPNYIGAHHAFVNSQPDRCGNCVSQANIVIEGFVHLNEAIAEYSGLGSFDPSAVKPYLQEHLHWRVQKASGAEVPLENVPSLEVTVSATWLSYQPGEDFPVPNAPVYHHDITHGRLGGARHHG